MPQMNPMNWLTLFLFFIIILTLFNIKTYYNFFMNKNNSIYNYNNKKKLLMNWKW
uniref:ATP synthase complex subunit 8 n=1 Tax=Pnyxia scabiei TaxID=1781627 RepID=A0A7L9R574_9DIPT|nr:ATP synthase F0 subunit 8 [Pnyxia scabiei]QOL10543.1 ATP synthase F0 subunit 8 [Pnyxia scabiei]